MDKSLRKFRGLTGMSLELAQRIYDAFGSCTALYECHSPEELIKNFEEMRAEDKSVDLAYWLDIQLGVEDSFGTPSEMRQAVKKRLANLL